MKWGVALVASRGQGTSQPEQSRGFPWWTPAPTGLVGDKNRVAAGILGIMLGGLGIHRFYLGYTTVGVCWIAGAILGFILFAIPTVLLSILGIIEGIMILTDSFH